VPTETKGTSTPIASIQEKSSATYCEAWVTASTDFPLEFLSRLVVYRPTVDSIFLGIIEDVYFEYNDRSAGYKKKFRLRHLLCLDKKISRPSPVRDAPPLGSLIYLADENDLASFFPVKRFPEQSYLGTVRGTSYPLPLNLDRLCFSNTAIVAGINHGKSHLAALIVSQLHLTKKKVLVIDPSGEWTQLIDSIKKSLEKNAHLEVKSTSIHAAVINLAPGDPLVVLDLPPPQWLKEMWESFRGNNLTVLDVSLSSRGDMTAEDKLTARCKMVYHIQQVLMRTAVAEYGKTKKPYCAPTCIVLDEAHEFVPSNPQVGYQKQLSILFSISTKEYRKYGSGHIFIDQSLASLHHDIQIQTFLLGGTTQPDDLSYLGVKLGENVVAAVQRTIGGTGAPSWVAFGTATPMTNLPWELESLGEAQLSILALKKEPSAIA